MPAMIAEVLLPEWTDEGWASYAVPLGSKGLTWRPTPRRPVTDPVPAVEEDWEMALAVPGSWLSSIQMTAPTKRAKSVRSVP